MKLKHILLFASLLSMLSVGCVKEYTNPNAATKDQVLASPDGLMGMVVGLRRDWSVGGTSAQFTIVTLSGLTAKELTVLNTGNGDLAAIEAGKSTLGPANSTMTNLWTSCNIIKANAQQLIDNASIISDAGTRAGVQAYGHLYKALAIGTMAQFWEQVPTKTVTSAEYIKGTRATFTPRAAALDEAIKLLQDATSLVNTTPPSAAFTAKVGTDIDLKNALLALTARFSLIAGKLDQAATAAATVDLTKLSTWKYDAANVNPVWRSSLFNNNTYGALANFGLIGTLAPEAADARIAFYLGNTGLAKASGFWKSDLDAIPFYLPSEMTLIRAEVLARQDKVAEAIIELNKVRTKATDALGVTAKLGAYSGASTKDAVLLDIYKQRCIELFMSGNKLEDSRRFGRPGPNDAGAERSRNFYPYPQTERDNNSSTPTDPSI